MKGTLPTFIIQPKVRLYTYWCPTGLHWDLPGMTELVLEETQPWAAIAWELPSSLKSLTIGLSE